MAGGRQPPRLSRGHHQRDRPAH